MAENSKSRGGNRGSSQNDRKIGSQDQNEKTSSKRSSKGDKHESMNKGKSGNNGNRMRSREEEE